MESLGIDAGGTLIKVAYIENETIHYKMFQSNQFRDLKDWIDGNFASPNIALTGGRQSDLEDYLGLPVMKVEEFIATSVGVKQLLSINEVKPGKTFLAVNIGTGTSIHLIKNGETTRVGGTGVGGGTILGLAHLLTGIKDFDKMVALAKQGNRDLDLKVKDIYGKAVPPIDGNITASNFGNFFNIVNTQDYSDADILAALIGMVAEVIVVISNAMAVQHDCESIVYIGSTVHQNDYLKSVLREYKSLSGLEPLFIENGEYSGALGALKQLK
ncbi:type II pantothenate kinase [Pseudalkalibacillus caeni]|uniref:Type II pantothenate kinase n=1 Tax=Exobacillus caeni TaxID=2574798 RepID=A0A5R9F6M2_9BACL|nr:type II pantothenate kinase [Pseudalkalibacillus caeni]TLS37278.1 type II pantothenate kinase [Pseudalkalibacillus caeni]